jgi:hypothetical protein
LTQREKGSENQVQRIDNIKNGSIDHFQRLSHDPYVFYDEIQQARTIRRSICKTFIILKALSLQKNGAFS